MNAKLRLFLISTAFAIVIVVSYCVYVQPVYDYFGMQINPEIKITWVVFNAIASGAVAFLLPRKVATPSNVFCALIYFLVFIPTINISYVALQNSESLHFSIKLYFFVCMILLLLICREYSFRFVAVKIPRMVFILGFSVASLGMLALVLFYYRPDFSAIFSMQDVSGVYDLRSGYRDANSRTPAIAQYSFSWLTKVIAPAIFVFGLIKKSKVLVGVAVAIMATMFFVSGHKSILLGFVAMAVLWRSLNSDKGLSFEKFGLLVFSVALIGLLFAAMGFPMLNDIIVRRSMIVSGLLSGYYIEFFSNNSLAYLSYSILNGVVPSAYPVSPPFVIGEHYFGRAEMSANASFLAAAFADFGFIGMIGFSIIVASFFKILDSVVKSKNLTAAAAALILLPTWALVDSSFLTVFLTHGLFFMAALLFLLPKSLIIDVRKK